MPFMIKKEGKQWAVKTKGIGGKTHGMHNTHEKALAQLQALYANNADKK